MPFDFKRLARGRAISASTGSAALFDALSNKVEGYRYLRAAPPPFTRWRPQSWPSRG